ncbi:MAG: response regulator [Chloroherpetonaceae bacterium]|nr:response regulator [Chloroherpetonaceae bacterium]
MKPQILFVDDEPQVLEALAQLFDMRYEVHTALGGEAAIAALERLPNLAVIVSDQRMPGIKGTEVLAAAAERVPNATRILLTGFADADAVVDSVNLGSVFRYIRKPWKAKELEDVIEMAVAAHRNAVAQQQALLEQKGQQEKTEPAETKKTERLTQNLRASLAALSKLSQKAVPPATKSDIALDTQDFGIHLTEESLSRLEQQQKDEAAFFDRLSEAAQRSGYENAFRGKSGKPKILVVDDEAAVHTALTELLADDYDVISATSANEAIDLLKRDAFVALLITDQRMPGKTGADLLIESRKYAPLVPKILITAYTDVEDIIRLINEGQIYRYIQKPWNAERLKALISEAVEMYMLQISLSMKEKSSAPVEPQSELKAQKKSAVPSLEALQALQNLRSKQAK